MHTCDSQGAPAHRSGGSRCPPALPLRWLHFPRTPPGWDTVLATGTGLVLASFCSDEQRPLFFSLNESPQRCISRLSVIIALRSMTCFYSLSFHSFNTVFSIVKVLILMRFNLPVFPFNDHTFGVKTRNSSAGVLSCSFVWMFLCCLIVSELPLALLCV